MADTVPETEPSNDGAEIDWDAWEKKLEDAGIAVPAIEPDVEIDLDALRFLPFTADEVSRMFVRLRRQVKV